MTPGISDEDRAALHSLWLEHRRTQPRKDEQLMTWRRPRLPRWAHVTLALVVAVLVTALGAYIAGQLIATDYLALGCGLLWGVIVGVMTVAYWQEVIDR